MNSCFERHRTMQRTLSVQTYSWMVPTNVTPAHVVHRIGRRDLISFGTLLIQYLQRIILLERQTVAHPQPTTRLTSNTQRQHELIVYGIYIELNNKQDQHTRTRDVQYNPPNTAAAYSNTPTCRHVGGVFWCVSAIHISSLCALFFRVWSDCTPWNEHYVVVVHFQSASSEFVQTFVCWNIQRPIRTGRGGHPMLEYVVCMSVCLLPNRSGATLTQYKLAGQTMPHTHT